MNKLLVVVALAGSTFFLGCNNSKPTEAERNETTKDSTTHDMSKMDTEAGHIGEMVGEDGKMMIHYFKGTTEYSDAKLEMKQPVMKDGKLHFEYNVENYKLAEQTPDADATHCNNSKKGQHIHFILNNTPYKALYKTEFDTALAPGHYVLLSFLSRSYHESIKNKTAFALAEFDIGIKTNKTPKAYTDPRLFYSRPKGEYVGDDAKTVLLDFYLTNTEISESGNKVKATINGKDFMLTKWTTYALIDLPMGENKIKLSLVDKDGKAVGGEENIVERTITLKEK
ncbi:MAG: hypothetical protein NTX03_12115 [Bacteroidetes bacterium]|nr:hypothetical protein [Bacteroidota bacterium]